MMGKKKAERHFFQGEKVRWISPADLKDLIKLKAEHPNAPLLVGNTTIGWFQEEVHASIYSVHQSLLTFLFSYRTKDESEQNCPSTGDLWWKRCRTSSYQMEKEL